MPARRTPKVEALVVNAIRRLQDVQGSTLREISNYISQEYDVPTKEIRRQVRVALQRGLSYGILHRSSNGYYSCNRDCLGQLSLGDGTGDGVMEPCPAQPWRFGVRARKRRRRQQRAAYRRRKLREERRRRKLRAAARRRRRQRRGKSRTRRRRGGSRRRRSGRRGRGRRRGRAGRSGERRRADEVEIEAMLPESKGNDAPKDEISISKHDETQGSSQDSHSQSSNTSGRV